VSTGGPHRVALLTPPGAGAIALIRVVGPDPATLVNAVFQGKSGLALTYDESNRLRFGRMVDGDETLDEVVAVAHAVGGLPAVDITAHGGTRIVERILQTLQGRGAEVCAPEDAAQRTWPAGCLLEREILEAMARAKTERALRFLSYQRTHLFDAIERLARTARNDPGSAEGTLREFIARSGPARALVDGVTVALVGPPNSGKSTLLNRLVGRDAALASDIAGTTRDWIAEPVEILGLPVTLVDTAGRHEASSPLEALAIEAGRRMAHAADLRVAILDCGADFAASGSYTLGPRDFAVLNKADLAPQAGKEFNMMAVSARTGAGVERLAERMLASFGLEARADPQPGLFTESQIAWANEVLTELRRSPDRAAARLQERIAQADS